VNKRSAVTLRQLAEHYGVALRTTQQWRERGMPARRKKGPHGALLYTLGKADQWLAAHGIVPGTHGKEGGRARRASRPHGTYGANGANRAKEDNSSEVPLSEPDGEEGLEATVGRLKRMERMLGGALVAEMAGAGSGPVERQGKIRNYQLIADQLRKTTAGLLDLEVMRGRLVPRDDLRDTVTHLAAILRSSVERFADDVPPRIVSALGQVGIEVGDIAGFQRALHDQAQKLADEWLRRLSDEVRQAGNGG